MEKLIISIIVSVIRIAFSYGICLLFTSNFNILEWSIGAKIWFLVISLILLSADDKD